MARLLTPEETGVFAVAAIFAAFASTFRDFGVAEYLIQEKEVTNEVIRAAFAVNIMISWAMCAVLLVLAPFVAEFYHHQGIAHVMQIQAISFLFIPFGAVTLAYFRRQMDFRPIFFVGVWASTVSFTTAIICALNGLSYLSLAWSSLAGVIATVAVSIWFRPAGFPAWPALAGVKRVISFGKYASGIYMFGQLGRGAPEMIIGRTNDLASVAIFSRGYGMLELFNRSVLSAISPICLPYFAKGSQQDGGVAVGYLKSMTFITVIGWPFFAFTGIVAFAAVRIIYGNQWMAAAPLAQILSLVAAIELTHYFSKEALMAAGHVSRSNSLQFYHQCARILGLLLVIPYGLTGACIGLSLASVVGFVLSQLRLQQSIGLKAKDVIRSCAPSAFISLVSSAPLLIWTIWIPIDANNYLWVGGIGGLQVLLVWLWLLWLLKHPLWKEFEVIVGKFGKK